MRQILLQYGKLQQTSERDRHPVTTHKRNNCNLEVQPAQAAQESHTRIRFLQRDELPHRRLILHELQ